MFDDFCLNISKPIGHYFRSFIVDNIALSSVVILDKKLVDGLAIFFVVKTGIRFMVEFRKVTDYLPSVPEISRERDGFTEINSFYSCLPNRFRGYENICSF